MANREALANQRLLLPSATDCGGARSARAFFLERSQQKRRSLAEPTVVGTLPIRGVTKPLTLKGELAEPIKDPWGLQRTSLSLGGKIARSEWGLTWNQALEFGGVVVSDDGKIQIEAEGVGQAKSEEKQAASV